MYSNVSTSTRINSTLYIAYICVCFIRNYSIFNTYIHCISLHGFNFLSGWSFCAKGTITITIYLHTLHFTVWVSILCMSPHHSDVPTSTAFHCMGTILCMGDLFAQRALSLSLHWFQLTGWVLFLCGWPYCTYSRPHHAPTHIIGHRDIRRPKQVIPTNI